MRRFPVRPLLLWGATLAVVTVGMLAVRSSLDKAHVALILLLVILGASAAAGRLVGLSIAALSFLVFNWFFLPPYYTFVIANPLDWLALVAFFVTGAVAAQLLYMAQSRARAEHERADEIDRLATVGAEALSAGSAAESLRTVAEVVRSSIDATACEVYTPADASAPPLVSWVIEHRNGAMERGDGTVHLQAPIPSAAELSALRTGDVTALLIPLLARERIVGVLRVATSKGLRLDEERLRFLRAMSYYVALAVERVRLVAETERAQGEQQAERMKNALLASVSHDLRTPLTTIKALAHDLSVLGDERSEIIEQEADRLNRSVADLLDMSRLNAGALPLRIELNAVDDLLGALMQRVEGALGTDRLRVRMNPPDQLLVGHFDFVHTLRIVANLVENAAKYAPTDTPIDLTVMRRENELWITVADRGPGVPPAEADRVFDAYCRSASTSPDVSGVGLGLSIARRLAEAQRGTLTYEPRDGGGSVFTLRVPAADLTQEIAT